MKKILFVDDEVLLLEVYKEILELKGYSVATASDGREAARIYIELSENGEKPDIVIMDFRMPFRNGIEASREILSFDSHARIIFASADASVAEEVASMGVLELKIKPVEMKKLILNIENFLTNNP